MPSNKTLSSVVLWSVISAAFIGPGTVTTAAMSGSVYQLQLLWAVTFATVSCILLQEISARIAIVSGQSMGQILDKKYGETAGTVLKYILGGPVILGCAAYEAGNILGAVSGIGLMVNVDGRIITVLITVTVFLILWSDRRSIIGWLMTALVGLMGIAFFALALSLPLSLTEYVRSSLVPTMPRGSELLTLGLVGTTIVPYNLFLGSGISKGQTVPLMRIGLTISVIIGGAITAAILVAGTGVPTFSNFNDLGAALSSTLGPVGGAALGIGLFAAGFSSAITSPYASSVIVSSVFGKDLTWQRIVWGGVLLTGFVFGISGIKPIPVILAVQALNGLVLPLITAFLILLVNDPGIIQPGYRNSLLYNGIILMVFGTVLVMGLHSIDKSISVWCGLEENHFGWILSASVATTLYLASRIFLRPVKITSS